jgi:hypothetical protein
VDETGRVTYTDEGAVSATEGGPLDPTVDPDYDPAAGGPRGSEAKGREGARDVEVVDRGDVAGLTGEVAPEDTGKAQG